MANVATQYTMTPALETVTGLLIYDALTANASKTIWSGPITGAMLFFNFQSASTGGRPSTGQLTPRLVPNPSI